MALGDDILSTAKALVTGDVQVIAKIVSTWVTAKQAVRTIATAVSAAASQSAMNQVMSTYQDVPLSPAVLADMSIRNLTIPADGTGLSADLIAEAAYSGISPARLAALSLDTGESYGIIDALRLWHQGTYLVAPVANPDQAVGQPAYIAGPSLGDTYGVPEAELDTVVYYSRVRNEFLPDLKKLSWSTMSPADAINAAVKGRISPDFAATLFKAGGGMPEQFELLYESAGDSIGVEHAVALYDHGDITADQLQDVILQSRINPRFYDVALLANKKWLSAFQIHQAVQAGEVDVALATNWMIEAGYPADQAAATVSAAAKGTVSKAKAETESIILDDYQANIIDSAAATTALTSLGYTAEAIPFILESVVAKRVISMRNGAISRIRTAYIDFLIDEAAVKVDLVQLGMPTAAVDQFLTDWTIEQSINTKRLSAAQVGKLLEDGVLDVNNAVTRWVQMGYLPEEANLLTFVYPPGSKAPAGTAVAVTTVPPDNTTTTPTPTTPAA